MKELLQRAAKTKVTARAGQRREIRPLSMHVGTCVHQLGEGTAALAGATPTCCPNTADTDGTRHDQRSNQSIRSGAIRLHAEPA